MLNFIYVSIAVIYIILLIFVFKRDLRSTINRYFILFYIGLLLWHVTLYLYLFVDLGPYLLFIGRLNYAAGPVFSLGMLGFFYYFPVENLRVPTWVKKLFWVVTVALALVTLLTHWVDKDEVMTEHGPVVTLGDGYYFYLAHIFLLPIVTLVLGTIKNFRLNGLNKLRFAYSFWVFVPSIIIFLLSNAVLPIFGIIDQFVYSPVFLFPIIVSSFYAIAKYRFLDIRFILARAVAFLLFTLVCASVYTLFLFTIINSTLQVEIDFMKAAGAFFLAIFAAITFQPALTWLHRVTNRLFFKGRYDNEKLLSELTQLMAKTIDLTEMTGLLLQHLTQEMRLSKGAFLIMNKAKTGDIFNVGYKKTELKKKAMAEFLKKFLRTNTALVFEELPEGAMKTFLREQDISIAIPIKVKNTPVAVLLLGAKLSGEIYNIQDINLLHIFASQAGIAIQNAQSYEEIKKFSRELEKRVEERTHELKESQERELAKARDLARLKDEFVFIASHELRTPITAIKGFMELITMEKSDLPKEVQENLHYMAEASNHLNQLINDLLEIARTEAGEAKIELKPIDMLPVIRSLMQELAPQAGQRQITMNITTRGDIGPVIADENKIKEVIMNLLSNAVKYNRDAGTVDISVFPIEKKLMIEVRDTGYGIPKEQQARIFQKFFRARNERTNKVMGTGLGLFITQMLVEKMKGTITFSSIEEQGTTFAVLLPLAKN